jgi:hypothetical protein
MTEFYLGHLPLYGGVDEWRARLRNLLVVEQKIDMISQATSRGEEGKETAMILISQAIPCIMHFENRVGEKIVTVLLAMAANKYQERSNIRSLTQFATIAQNIFNTKILGRFDLFITLKLPMSVKGNQVSKVSFSNKKLVRRLTILLT